jgi:hypothetical protein
MCPISGANWNNGSNAGVWALNLNNARTNSNTNVGFRADSVPPHGPRHGHGGTEGDAFRLVSRLAGLGAAKSACRRLSGSRASGERQAAES